MPEKPQGEAQHLGRAEEKMPGGFVHSGWKEFFGQKQICIWQLINIPVSGKRHLREKKSFFRESFATPSPRPFVCSVRSGAIVAAAVLANTVVAVHLRAVRSVKCRQSPSFALATCGCRRCAEPCNKLPGLSPVFRGSFAKLAPK